MKGNANTNSLQRIQRSLGHDAYRLTPATYAYHVSGGKWIPAKHLLYIAARVASAIAKGGGRLIISVPPRHGKSQLLSTWAPQWALDRNPASKIALTSYGAELSTEFGRAVRDNILATPEYTRARLRKDVLQTGRFQTTKGGGMISVGVGGPLTGRGADILLVDDFVKNTKDASSETVREQTYDWFLSTAMSRLEPGGSAIVVATRWNVDDLIGRLLKYHGDVWEHIRIPAVIETEDDKRDDPLGRDYGEPLWPERYSAEEMANIKALQGDYFWKALYQQRPVPRTGGMIARGGIPIIDIAPSWNVLRLVRYWDLAGTAGGGDFTCGALLAIDDRVGLTYILDVVRFQRSPLEVEQAVAQTAAQDGTRVKIIIEQEPGSAGKSIASHYTRHVLRGYNVKFKPSTGDKFDRAQPFYASLQAGNVKLLRAPWNGPLEEELELFPDAEHDDQVDACSGAFNELHEHLRGGVVWGRDSSAHGVAYGSPNKGKYLTGVIWGRD